MSIDLYVNLFVFQCHLLVCLIFAGAARSRQLRFRSGQAAVLSIQRFAIRQAVAFTPSEPFFERARARSPCALRIPDLANRETNN